MGIIDDTARTAGTIAGGVLRIGQKVAGQSIGRVQRLGRRDPDRLTDQALARKVESIIFRDKKAQKGKIDVNAADGVVSLRGEAKTPDLIKELERRTREIPEVQDVENLLHLPKTPAPTRADSPGRQRRKGARPPRKQGERKVEVGKVTSEKPSPKAEPSPKETARQKSGRKPAPLDG